MENLLNKEIKKEYGFNAGEGLNLAAGLVGLIIGIILSVGVALPITQSVVTAGNFTGVTQTVVQYIPVFVAIVPMMLTLAFF